MTTAPVIGPPAPAPLAGHDVGERLYLPGSTLVHRLPAHVKLVAAFGFVLVVVATPIRLGWAFAGYAALLLGVLALARLPAARLLPRMAVELPFVGFALLLPFVGRGPDVVLVGLSLSEPGLHSAATILAKATLGVATSVLLAATTRTHDLLGGLARLHLPEPLVQIASFMLRFVHVTADQWSRMGRARAARGFDATGPRSWPVLARSLGVLFIRSFERGERVHLAMLSRGYSGRMPVLRPARAEVRDWAAALALPLAAAGCLVAAMLLP